MELSLIEARKKWRMNVANAGSINDARCYKDNMQEICQSLSTAFDLTAQSQSTNSTQAADEQTVFKVTIERDHRETAGSNTAEEVTETQNAKMQDADEQPVSAMDQSNGETDEYLVTFAEPAEYFKTLSSSTSFAKSAAQDVATQAKLSSSPIIEAIRSPFALLPLEPAFSNIRALYLHLLYHDRFTLLSSTSFLLFLSQQPQLSHTFLRYLIGHPFGIRYVHRDGSNANHGITPFQFPFLPVRRDLPLSLYFDNRWALLNDPAWLEWVSTEEFIMASFWTEMSFRGGLGAMRRRKEVSERASNFAMSPF
ncbi:hypothetical protein N0V93_000558 [Gnomoniopsis smithogilvyi]|uniref:Uncharacterized protein n=1 Tax=Gnomoniopsis smithogilvyi TaxID=1191159 RepID=A0A9W8Z0E2_9PEZI|nr:hypothetical protein N0V93_000558 [Gnomoniopsis smithogilvyi]